MIPAEEIDDLSDVPEEDRRAEIYDQPEFEAVHDLAHKRLSPEEAAEEARKLLAMRQLARKRLLPFVMTFRPGYKAGWMHRRICQELEKFLDDVVKGKSPRLMLFMPPRSGKSELGSRSFPAWAIGKYPWLEIISTSYAASLANSFSRKAREILRDTVFAKIFPDCILDKDNQSVEQWMTTEGGGYVSAGVMGSIVGKGAHCFPAGTMVTLADGSTMDISEESIVGKDVLSYNVTTGELCVRRVTAWQEVTNGDGLYSIESHSGHGVRATGNHPFYSPALGWVRADDLKEGYTLIVDSSHTKMSALRDEYKGETERYSQASSERAEDCGLHPLLPRAIAEDGQKSLRNVRGVVAVEADEVLRQAPAFGVSHDAGRGMPSVQEDVPSEVTSDSNVFGGVCESITQHADDWEEQPKLQGRDWVQQTVDAVRLGKTTCEAPRWEQVRIVRGVRRAGSTSHRREQGERCGGESGDVMPAMSQRAAPRESSVREAVRVGDCNVPVYDIQVEGTECFFANGILVHNCLIIDDPTKGKAEARSETIQEQIRDWYTSSAYTRLAPGGGVLIIMQRWTEDDLAGWLLEEDAAKPEELRENWNVIRFPAIAEEDEEFRLKGEALHPERYPLELLNRIKATLGDADFSALYQQNPLPDSGDYFKDSDFKWYNPTECPPLSDLNVYAAWDLAIGEKQKNDQSVGVYVGLDCNGKMWVLHIEATRKNSLALAKIIFELNDIYKPINTGFEKGHIEGTMGPFLEKMMMDGEGSFFPYEALPVGNQDKSARATTIRGLMQHGIVWFRKFDSNQEAAKAEMLKFPNGKHDDNVDAMAHIGRMVESLVAKRVHTEKKKDTWRDKFMKKMMKEMRKKGLR